MKEIHQTFCYNENYVFGAIPFFYFHYFLSFLKLNINIIVFREFAKEKERVESRAGFMALKEQQKLEKELTGYVEWICRAGDFRPPLVNHFKIFPEVFTS